MAPRKLALVADAAGSSGVGIVAVVKRRTPEEEASTPVQDTFTPNKIPNAAQKARLAL